MQQRIVQLVNFLGIQVQHPTDYARVVKQIGNEMDLTHVDLEGLLPSATIMVVTVTATTTSGKKLSEEDLTKTMEACDCALQLDEDKRMVLEFIESQMHKIAPNMSEVLGTEITAKLIGLAGKAMPGMLDCGIRCGF